MNKQIQELLERINAERHSIDHLFNQIDKFEQTFNEEELSADDRAMIAFFQTIADQLEDIAVEIDFYNSPVTRQGQLHRNKNGRYEVEGYELQCGQNVEFLKSIEGQDEWVKGRVEHSGIDYHILRHPGNLERLQVRIR